MLYHGILTGAALDSLYVKGPEPQTVLHLTLTDAGSFNPHFRIF
jgi:hypothetical protein